MGPKILAAVNFIENGGKEAIITEASQVGIEGSGTRIIN
jgi:carbamate kinase